MRQVSSTLTAERKKGKYVYYRCSHGRGKCPLPYTREEERSEGAYPLASMSVLKFAPSQNRVRVYRGGVEIAVISKRRGQWSVSFARLQFSGEDVLNIREYMKIL
jgi:hypothetical protein